MSAEHRKPAVAFALLALFAATLVGIQRADAEGGRFLAAVAGATVHVHGKLPAQVDALTDTVGVPAAALGPAFDAVLTGFRSDRRAEALVGPRRSDDRERPAPRSMKKSAARPQVENTSLAHAVPSSRGGNRPAVTGEEAPGGRIGHRVQRAPEQARHELAREQRRAERLEQQAEKRVELARLQAERRAERLERETERLEQQAEKRVELARLQADRRAGRLDDRAERLERAAERRIERAAGRSSWHHDSPPLHAPGTAALPAP